MGLFTEQFQRLYDYIYSHERKFQTSGGDTSNPDDDTMEWPPNPSVTLPSHQSSNEAPTIAVAIWHQRGELGDESIKAADYVEYALREAYGDRYHITVTVRACDRVNTRQPLKDVQNEFEGQIRGRGAKDANIMLVKGRSGGFYGYGGGRTGIVANAERIDTSTWKLYKYGNKKSDEIINVVLHEVGHCIGLSHDDGRVEHYYGGGYVTPMETIYTDTGQWVHTYSQRASEKQISIQ